MDVSDTLPGVPAVPVAATDTAVSVPSAVTEMPPAVVVRTFCSSRDVSLVTTIAPGDDAESRPKFADALIVLAGAFAVPAVRRPVAACSSEDPPMLVADVMVRPPPMGMKTTGSVPTTTAVFFTNERAVNDPESVAFCESRSDVPLEPRDAIVVPPGMPAPVTSMPTASPAVETRLVTLALLAVVVPSNCVESLNCHEVFWPCVPPVT